MENKQTQREREGIKLKQRGIDFMNDNSPTNSPVRAENPREEIVEPEPSPSRNKQENKQSSSTNQQDNHRSRNHQAATGKKRKKRFRAKAYRTIERLQHENKRYKTLWERIRKKVQRLSKHTNRKGKINRKKSQYPKVKYIKVTKIVRKIYKRTGHSVTWNIEMRRKIRSFLEEDINSTQAPGKKDTITRGKTKMQKRYINDTLMNLYKGFLEKHPESKMSYASFCRLRPFWIVQRNINSRETCLCKLHENVRFRVEKLHRLHILDQSKPDKIIEQLVCDINRKECAYGECNTCRNYNKLKTVDNTEERAGEQVTYSQWVNKNVEISTKDGRKNVNKTMKISEQNTIETILKETTTSLKDKYARHVFNIRHQYRTMKQVKYNLSESEAAIHVDFSENYNCKLSEEVQSMHFGGSRNQISLHTVVVYTKDKVESLCTVSENTQHGPGAIWAHLRPVLQCLKESHPEVTTVHFLSDGPCTQYRSKNHFYMFHQEILDNYGFENATWNFSESGHGKSAADGVGGTVKRTADRLVANGTDIPDAKAFYKHVGDNLTNVRLFFVESADIESFTMLVPSSLQTVKGTMKLHQVVIGRSHRGIMRLKVLSCFCRWPDPCDCYIGEVSEHHFVESRTTVPTPENVHDSNTTEVRENEALDNHDCSLRPHPELVGTENEALDNHDFSLRPHPELVGTWCVVSYEGDAYPGIIQELDDESAEVKCMCRIGVNRFFWPLVDDIIWYQFKDILMAIPEPRPVTARHVQIDPDKWTLIRHILQK